MQGFVGYNCDKDVNECASVPCENEGTCENNFQYYSCHCMNGYAGANCEIDVNECMSFPCVSGGQCVQGMHRYSCVCRSGFEGTNCEINVDECSSAPCQHGGTCIDKPHSYRCACSADWGGVNCAIHGSDMCSNCDPEYARCYKLEEDAPPVCQCISGYTTSDNGKNCEYMNVCDSNPCLNSGTCTDMHASYECVCSPGHSGVHCEHDIDECASEPCKNGAKCTQVTGGTFVCGDPVSLSMDLDIDPTIKVGSPEFHKMQTKLIMDLAKSLGVDPRRVSMSNFNKQDL